MNSTYTIPSKRGRKARQIELPNKTHTSMQAYNDETLLYNSMAIKQGMADFLRKTNASEIPEDQIGEAAVSSANLTNEERRRLQTFYNSVLSLNSSVGKPEATLDKATKTQSTITKALQ